MREETESCREDSRQVRHWVSGATRTQTRALSYGRVTEHDEPRGAADLLALVFGNGTYRLDHVVEIPTVAEVTSRGSGSNKGAGRIPPLRRAILVRFSDPLELGVGGPRSDQGSHVSDSLGAPKAIASVERYNELRQTELVKCLLETWDSDSKLPGRSKAKRLLRPSNIRQVGNDARLIKEFRNLVVEHRQELAVGLWSTDKVQHSLSLCAEATAQERQQSFVSSHRLTNVSCSAAAASGKKKGCHAA